MKNLFMLASLICTSTFYCMDTDERSPLLEDTSERTQTSIGFMQDAFADANDTPIKKLKDLSRDEIRDNQTSFFILNLSHQELTHIEDDASEFLQFTTISHGPPLIDCTKIIELDLSNNNLTRTNLPAFKALTNLRTCILSHNHIEKADIGAFFQVWPDISCINLAHNKITDDGISWSPHTSWLTVEGSKNVICHSLPIIRLEENQITRSGQEWLVERYKKELNRSADLVYAGDLCLPFIGTFLGGVAGGIPAAGSTCCIHNGITSLIILGAISPIGAALGCVAGTAVTFSTVRDHLKNEISTRNVPIYFQKNQTVNHALLKYDYRADVCLCAQKREEIQ